MVFVMVVIGYKTSVFFVVYRVFWVVFFLFVSLGLGFVVGVFLFTAFRIWFRSCRGRGGEVRVSWEDVGFYCFFYS